MTPRADKFEDGHLSASVPSEDPPVAVLEHDRQLAWEIAA